jgi:Flp pilus assembly protein TadG
VLLANSFGQSVSPRQTRSAVAAVEMAFVVPVLALMMLGMFELSRGVMVKQILTGAARKGCRTGIVQAFGNSDIINDATNVMRDNGFTSSQFNPNPPSGTSAIGAINITVTDPSGNTWTDAMNAPSGSSVAVQVVIPATSVNWVSSLFMTKSMFESDLVVMMKQ